MTPGALIFMLVAWTAVLGTMVWAFSRILASQKKTDGTSYLDADVTIDEHVPPPAA